MRGTEKQIRFAEDLIDKAVKSFDIVKNIEGCPEYAIKQMAVVSDRIKNAEYAGDVIDLLRDEIKEPGMEFCRCIFSKLKIGVNPLIKSIREDFKSNNYYK